MLLKLLSIFTTNLVIFLSGFRVPINPFTVGEDIINHVFFSALDHDALNPYIREKNK